MKNLDKFRMIKLKKFEHGIDDEELAGELGRSRTYVSARLNGKQPWTVPDAIAMQRLFGWSAEETLKYTYGG